MNIKYVPIDLPNSSVFFRLVTHLICFFLCSDIHLSQVFYCHKQTVTGVSVASTFITLLEYQAFHPPPSRSCGWISGIATRNRAWIEEDNRMGDVRNSKH